MTQVHDTGYDELAEAVRAGAAEAAERLRAAVAEGRDRRGGHARWARLCEEVGEPGLALTEYQLALRDDPEDVAALCRLSTLYEERGDLEHAIECAERWAAAAPADAEPVRALLGLLLSAERFERAREAVGGAPGRGLGEDEREGWVARIRGAAAAAGEAEEEADLPPGLPSDADVVRFLHLFAGRENVYARQWAGEKGEGGYSPVREPLTPGVARNHLLGTVTVGVYPVRLDNTVTFFAFDVDIRKQALARARGSLREARRVKEVVAAEARRLQEALAALGVPALLEDSGYKGRHLWVFLEAPEDAAVARQFGGLFQRACPLQAVEVQMEFFPKQARTEAGIGNLIKLPLGIHRRTGRRSRLLQPDGTAFPDPFEALRRHPRVAREALYGAIGALKVAGGGRGPEHAPTLCPPPTEPEGDEAPPPDRTAVAQVFPAPPPAWTAADFETNPEVSHILSHCPVLDALKTKVEEHRRLSHDEQIVLAHSLGHSGAGVLAVNYLLDACVDVAPAARLQSPLAGNPISCPKIRKRIPNVTGSVPCNCRFDFAPERYPTPRLHLLTLPSSAPAAPAAGPPAAPPWDPADRARALRVLHLRREELEAEVARLEAELLAYMETAAVPEVAAGEGVLRLVHEEGAPPALVWEPAAAAPPEPPGETSPTDSSPPSSASSLPSPPEGGRGEG